MNKETRASWMGVAGRSVGSSYFNTSREEEVQAGEEEKEEERFVVPPTATSICDVFHTPADIGSSYKSTSLSRYPSNTHLYSHKDARRLGALVAVCSVLPTSHLLLARSDFQNLEKEEEENGKREEVRSPPTLNPCAPVSSHGEDDDHFYNGCAAENDHLRDVYSMLGHLRTEEALLLRELRGGSRSRGGDRGEEEEEKRNNKVEKKEPSNEFNVVASKGRITHATNPTASHRSTDNDRSYSTTNGVQVGSNSNNRSAGVRPSPLPLTTTPITTTATATSAPQKTAASFAVRELNSNTTGGVLRGSSRGGGGGGREGVVVAHQYVSGKPKPILGVREDLHEVHIGDERNHSNPRHNNKKLGEAAEDGSISRSSSKVLAAEKELLSLRGRILKIQSLIEGHAMREWEIFKRIVRACPLPYIVRYPTATHYSPALLDHGDGIPSMQTERARGREKVEVFAAGPSKRDLPPSRIKYIFFLMTSDTSPSRMRKALIYAQKSAGGRVLGVHIPHSREIDRTSHHRLGKESVAVDHSDNFSGESSPNTSSSRSSSSSTSSTSSSSSSVRVADHRKGEGRRGNRTPPSSSLSPSHSYSSTSAYVPFNYLMLSHDFVSNSTTHGLHTNFSTSSSTSAGLPSFPASTCMHIGGESQRGVSKRCANEGICFLVIHNLELASGAVTSVLLDAMKYGVVSATRAEALEACGLRGYFNGSLAEREESPEQKVAEEKPQFLGAGSKREGKHRNHQNLFGEGSGIRNDRQEGGGSRAGNYDSNTSTLILGGKVEKERERRDKGGAGRGEGGGRGQTILRPTVAADEHHPSLRDPNETRHVGGQSLDALCPAPSLSLPPHVVLFGEGPMCCGARLRSSTRAGEQFREVGSASLPPPRATATEKERKGNFRIAIPIPCVRFVGITDSETLYEVDRRALSPSLREAFGLSTTITPSSLGLFPSVATAASKVENHGRAAVEKTVAQHAVDEEDRVGNEGMSRGDIREDLHIRRSPAFTEEERGDTYTEKTRISKQTRGRRSGEKRGEEMGGCDVAIQALEPCVVSANNLLFLLYGGGGRSRTTGKARRKGSKRRNSNKDLTGASSKLNSQFAIARGNRPAHSQGTPSRVRSRGRGSFADPMRADSSDCADESEREGNNGFLSSPLSDDDDVDDDEDNDNGAMRGGEFIHSILQDDSFVFCAPFVSYYLRQLIVSLQMRTIPFSQQMTKVMGRNYYFITVLKCLAALLTPCNSLARSRARDAAVVRKGYPVGGIEGGLPVSRGTESCSDTHGIRKKSWGAFKCPPTNKEPAVPTPLVRAVVTVSDVICLLPHMTSHLLPINRLEMYSMSIPVRRMRLSSSSLLSTPTLLPDKKSSTIMFLKGEAEGQRQQLNKTSSLLTKNADAKKTAAAPRTMGSASKNQTKKSVENEPFVDLAVLLAAIQDEYANVLVSTDPSERREEEESNHLLRRIVSSCLLSRREGTSEEDVGISESMHTRLGARQGAETIAASLTLGLGGPFNGGNRGAYTAGTQIRPISGLNMHAHSANTYGMMMADEQLETFSPLSFAVRPASPASGGQRQSTNIYRYSLSEAPKASGMISSRERNYMYAPSTSAKKALDAGNVYNDYAVLIPTSSLPRSTVAAWDMLGTNSDMVPWGKASWESTTIHQTFSENTSRRGVPASCGVEGVSGRSGAPDQTRRADKETLSIRDGVEVKRDSDISCDSERLSLFYNRFHGTLEGQRLLELSVYVYALERRRAREILGVGVEKSIGRPEKSSRDADSGSAEVDVALLITSEIVDVVTSEIDCKNNRAFNRRRVASTRRMMNADRESQPNALFALFGAHESRKACLASVSEKPSRFDKVHELKEQRENVRKILFLSALEHLTFTEVFCLVSQCGYERSEGVEEEGLD